MCLGGLGRADGGAYDGTNFVTTRLRSADGAKLRGGRRQKATAAQTIDPSAAAGESMPQGFYLAASGQHRQLISGRREDVQGCRGKAIPAIERPDW